MNRSCPSWTLTPVRGLSRFAAAARAARVAALGVALALCGLAVPGDARAQNSITAIEIDPTSVNEDAGRITVRALRSGADTGTGHADSDPKTAAPMGTVDNPPTMTTTLTFAENERTVPDPVQATDPDEGDAITGYAPAGTGMDNGKFTIDASGTPRLKTAPHFEAMGSAAGDNDYKITVTATSGTGTLLTSSQQTITVTVADVNEPPEAPDDPVISEETDNSFKVSWGAPANTGPAIHAYDAERREVGQTQWQGATGAPTITHMTPPLVGQTLMANTDSIADAKEVLESFSYLLPADPDDRRHGHQHYRRDRATYTIHTDDRGTGPPGCSRRRGCSVALDPLARPVRNGRESHDGRELR